MSEVKMVQGQRVAQIASVNNGMYWISGSKEIYSDWAEDFISAKIAGYPHQRKLSHTGQQVAYNLDELMDEAWFGGPPATPKYTARRRGAWYNNLSSPEIAEAEETEELENRPVTVEDVIQAGQDLKTAKDRFDDLADRFRKGI